MSPEVRAARSSVKPTLVVFDLGGVLVRICRGIDQAAARAGMTIPAEYVAPAKRAERRAVHNEYELGRLTCEEFFARIAATAPGVLTPSDVRVLHERWIIEEYAGVGGLIDDLHAAGVDTGILSNTNHAHWQQIVGPDGDAPAPTAFPSTRKPRHRHASHLLGLSKPDVAVYHAVTRRTGHPAASTVFFDDLEDNIAGARAAGWQAHQIDPAGDTAGQMRGWLVGVGVL